MYAPPSFPTYQSHQRDRASGHQGNVSRAPPAVESVQSSYLWRIGRAGFFPVLRLDQSSPAKPTRTTMIAGTIPRREARSWSYTGLRHTRLQPQTQQGQRREGWTWPYVQRRHLCDRSVSCAKGDRASEESHQRDSRQALLACGTAETVASPSLQATTAHEPILKNWGPDWRNRNSRGSYGDVGFASYILEC